MDETTVATAAGNDVYRKVSRTIFMIVMVLLVAVGLALPLLYIPHQLHIYRDMGRKLPILTQLAIDMSMPAICLLLTGFLGTAIVLMEFLAPPKLRYSVNMTAMIGLLIWGACYVYVVSLPMWTVIQAKLGQ